MKQYLVVKLAESLSQVADWIAMPGLYTREAAEQIVSRASAAEPEARFLIQEVGVA